MSVLLNQQDCTANLDFSEDGLTAQPFVSEVLCRFWSGVRGNASALTGKLKFAVTITEVLQEDDSVHEVLIGLSSRSTDVAQLGTGNSYAFSSSGEKWTASKAEAFGRAFGVGDKVWCFLDLDSDVCTVSFAVNQNWLGAAFDIVRPARTQSALFPHILVRNFKVQVDFEGQNVEADWPAEAASFQPWPVRYDQRQIMIPTHFCGSSILGVLLCCAFMYCTLMLYKPAELDAFACRHAASQAMLQLLQQLPNQQVIVRCL